MNLSGVNLSILIGYYLWLHFRKISPNDQNYFHFIHIDDE
mgnify:FL=1